jgi:hypothetical protein
MEKNVRLEKEVQGLLSINKGLEVGNKKLQKFVVDIQASIVCSV